MNSLGKDKTRFLDTTAHTTNSSDVTPQCIYRPMYVLTPQGMKHGYDLHMSQPFLN